MDAAPSSPLPRLGLAREPALHWPDGRQQPLGARDAALLAWLALEGPCSRAQMAALLWPEQPADAARNALRQRLFQLRRLAGLDLAGRGSTLALAPGVEHDLDGATSLLAGLHETWPTTLAHWLARQREQRATLAAARIADRCEAAERAGDWPAALDEAHALLALQPLSEAAHRRLMRLHYLAGDRAAALLAFDRCERVLKDEVGTRPDAETLALLATIDASTPAVGAPHPASRRTLPATLLRPPHLVGRDAELATLSEVLAEGRTAVLSGEAGLGKSRLLGELSSRHAAGGGAPLLAVQARPGDGAVPFATVLRCLRALHAHAPAPPDAAPLARLMPELGTAPSATDDDGLGLLQGLQAWLADAAGRVGGLLIDDLHFVDDASAALLHGALAGELPLACVLATRPQASPAADRLRRAVADAATTITLEPLDMQSLGNLLASLALPDLDAAAVTPRLHQLTGGNPLYALEALKLAWRENLPLAQARPDSVQQLIAQRLRGLSSDALALARLAAMAGPDFGVPLAEAVLHTPALRLADAWNELEQAQVLRGPQFAHDLVFETVLQGVPEPIARHTHRALAQWLSAQGGALARVAAHWREAGEPAQAVVPWRQAADQALDRGVPAEARAHLENAIDAARAAAQPDAEFDALDELHFVYTLDDPGAAHDELVHCMQALARNPLQRLRAADAAHNLRRRRALPPELDALRADLAQALALGDDEITESLVHLLVGELTRAGRVDEALAVHGTHRALFERAGDPGSRCTQLGNLGVLLANLDRFSEADRFEREALAIAQAHAISGEAMVTMSNRLRVLRGQGRAAALDWIEAIDRQHATVGDNLRAWVQSRLGAAETLREAGRFGESLAMLAVQRERLATFAGVLAPAWAASETSHWLAIGQHARALQVARAIDADAFGAAPPWLQARIRLVQAQALARAAGEGLADRPGAEAWALLREAGERAPRQARRGVGFEVQLQRAAWSDADTGLALAEGAAEATRALGLIGLAAHAAWLAAGRAIDAAQPAAAAAAGALARSLGVFAFEPGGAPEPVLPTATTPGWLDAQRVRLARALGEADAADQAAAARARLAACAARQIAPPFVDAFLHRHPAHAALWQP